MKPLSFKPRVNRPDPMIVPSYRPNPRPVARPVVPPAPVERAKPPRRGHASIWLLLVVVLGIGLLVGFKIYRADRPATKTTTAAKSSLASASAKTAAAAAVNQCAGNTLSQLVLVSISQRHMWACSDTTKLYDSAVVTGMENLPADLTPTGTYHIYAKETDIHLIGHDSTGSWNDFVNYWMPFLDNQYGAYGFHDATWRAANAFGNISPYSSNASHGCVEMPLAAAKWLYGWAVVGTTVTVES